MKYPLARKRGSEEGSGGHHNGRRSEKRHLLLTGRPGVGKTTVVRAVVDRLTRRPAGFYTEEIRAGGVRRGFFGVTFKGASVLIAHVNQRGPVRVGRYGVDVDAIDRLVALSLIDVDAELFVVDEIGKMECLSNAFVAAMRGRLDGVQSGVATVGQRGGGFIAEVKARTDVELWEVTRANRNEVPGRVLDWLATSSRNLL